MVGSDKIRIDAPDASISMSWEGSWDPKLTRTRGRDDERDVERARAGERVRPKDADEVLADLQGHKGLQLEPDRLGNQSTHSSA